MLRLAGIMNERSVTNFILFLPLVEIIVNIFINTRFTYVFLL